MPAEPVTVLIADDNGLFVQALEALLDSEDLVRVVGRAEDGDKATRLAKKLEPDVVLMDLSMPRVDGFEAARQIRDAVPSTRIVVLTGSANPDDVARAREVGAVGYVTKDKILAELVRAIRAAAGRG